jgi:hypothetical protein
MRKVKFLKAFAVGGVSLILASSTPAAWGQAAQSVAGPTVSATQSNDTVDQDLARGISQASSEGKDVAGVVGLQLEGEWPSPRATRTRPGAISRPLRRN